MNIPNQSGNAPRFKLEYAMIAHILVSAVKQLKNFWVIGFQIVDFNLNSFATFDNVNSVFDDRQSFQRR